MIDSVLYTRPDHAPQCLIQMGRAVRGRGKRLVMRTIVANDLSQIGVLRRCCLFLLVALFCLLSQQQSVLAQINNPPQVEPVANREMYLGDEIQINLNASDPNEFDIVTFMEEPSLLPLPTGAELFPSGDGSGFILFAPTAAGVYEFAVVAVDNGTPQGRTAVFFQVTVKEKPATFADMAITNITVQSPSVDGKVRQGDPFIYRIDVANTSAATLAASDATLTLMLDRYLTLQSGNDACTVLSRTVETTEIQCELGTLAPAESHQLQFTVRPTDVGVAINRLSVDTTTLDPITANDHEISEIEVEEPLIDLALAKRWVADAPIGAIEVGDRVLFQLTVSNNWTVPTNFSLVDTYSPGLKLISVEGTSFSTCTIDGQQVRCDDTIASLGSVVFTVVAEIIQQGELSTTGVLTGLHADPDESNNRATAQLSALAVGDLRITINIPNREGNLSVGDVLEASVTVAASSELKPMAFAEATATFSIPNGFHILRAEEPVGVQCLWSQISMSCTKSVLQAGEQFTVPFQLYAVRAGIWQADAKTFGQFYRDLFVGNNSAVWIIEVGEPLIPWIYIHTFDDRNGNGRQDSGEPGLPQIKIDTTSSDGGEVKAEAGNTDNGGLLKQSLLDNPNRIQIRAQFTPTEEMTPTISVKLNVVPPTGRATVTGGTACGMTVGNNDGSTITLPCSDEDTVEWVDQVDASVADLTARLSVPLLQAAANNDQVLAPQEISFVIDAVDNQMLYLPFIAR